MVDPNNFDIQFGNFRNKLYSIHNSSGMSAQIMNYGAKLVSLEIPDQAKNLVDVVLGFDNISDYLNKEPYFGAVCGRSANRIANASFNLQGKTYVLSQNEGRHHLHGGKSGFNAKYWHTENYSSNSVSFSYLSKDLEEGYPGNLLVTVTYSITEDNQFQIFFRATSDQTTIFNPCHHDYFNLRGGHGTILSHKLFINADYYTELDADFICTGKINSVNHPTDFRSLQTIGDLINHPFYKAMNGLDYNWILNKNEGKELSLAAQLVESSNNLQLEVWTDLPAIQVYTGNYIEENRGKYDIVYQKHSAICLEAQNYPNAANIPSFPSIILNPNKTVENVVVYKFKYL